LTSYTVSRLDRHRPDAAAATDGRPGIVVVSHVHPWPATAGNEYRLARLIAWLESTGYAVHLVYRPFDPVPDRSEVRALASRYPRLYVFDAEGASVTFATDVPAADDAMMRLPDRPAVSHPRELAADRARLEPHVLDMTLAFAPDALVSLVGSLAQAVDAPAVIAQYIFMSRVLQGVPLGTMRMLDLIDLFSSKVDKVRRFGIDDWSAVSKESEAYLLARADVAIAIQPEEAEGVRALVPGVPIITAGIDYPVVASRRKRSGSRVLVVGSDNPMNTAGLLGFIRYAWPTILAEVPRAELAVVGSVGRVLSGAETGVRVLGRVEDLDDAYASARVAINPSFAGTGVKVKTLEAIAHLRPIVVWPSGADGLAPEVRAACSIATDWSAFARQVIRHVQRTGPGHARGPDADAVAAALSPARVYAELRHVLEARGASPAVAP
jgi:hypothetical protein